MTTSATNCEGLRARKEDRTERRLRASDDPAQVPTIVRLSR